MEKNKRRGQIICIMCTALFVCAIVVEWVILRKIIEANSGYVENTIALISLMTAGISVFAIIYQLRESKRIQEAEFIVHLNQAYVENDGYAKVYTELEKSQHQKRKPKLTRAEISNYLTFFETVYILLRQKAINIKNLDDLFEYRFFLAIHDKTVQKMKLVKSPYNFRNIYYLEKIWTQYREENELPIYHEENCLYFACIKAGKKKVYQEFMRDLEKEKRR